MTDLAFTDRHTIASIVRSSSRLQYLLEFTYQITLNDILSIRVDGDNFKIDVNTNTETLRFKAKGVENVILKNPETGILQLTLDPALAQAIYAIVDEYL